MRKVWQTINKIIAKSAYTPKIAEIDLNGHNCNDPKAIADSFNHYFSNLGPSLARDINQGNVRPKDYLQNRITQSLFLNPVTPTEIKKRDCVILF